MGKILLDDLCEHVCVNSDPCCVAGTSVTQLMALDADGEPLIYGVVGEEAMRYFAVERNTGVVWLRQPLDREVRTHAHTHSHTLTHYGAYSVPWFIYKGITSACIRLRNDIKAGVPRGGSHARGVNNVSCTYRVHQRSPTFFAPRTSFM